MRGWLTQVLGAEGVTVERVGQWGGQIITSQWRCQACNSYFEALREDFDDPGSVDPRHGPAR
jgi:hypothetical protein